MVRRVLPFAIAALVVGGCQKKVDIVKSAIVVNGESIGRDKVDQAADILQQSLVRAYPEKALEGKTPELYKTAAYQLVSNAVMIVEADKKKIPADTAKVDSTIKMIKRNFPNDSVFEAELKNAGQTVQSMKKQISDGMKLDSLLKSFLATVPAVSDDDCKKFFDENKDKYVSNPKARVSQLVFPVDSAMTQEKKDKVKKSADEALALIKGGKAIDAVIKQYAKSGAVGGDAGFVNRGDMRPVLEAELEKLKKGETSSIIPTEIGYVILQKTDEQAGAPVPYEEAKEHVKFMVDMKRKNSYMESLVDSLIQKATIVYNDTTLTPLPKGSRLEDMLEKH
jgi:parvulin-like peptidyl-prolyl isomerase